MSSFGSFTLGSIDFQPVREGEYYTTTSSYDGDRQWISVSNFRERVTALGNSVFSVDIGIHDVRTATVDDKPTEIAAHVTVKYTFAEGYTQATLDGLLSQIATFVTADRMGRILLGAK